MSIKRTNKKTGRHKTLEKCDVAKTMNNNLYLKNFLCKALLLSYRLKNRNKNGYVHD